MSHYILLTHWLTGFLIYAVRNIMAVPWLTAFLIYAVRNVPKCLRFNPTEVRN